MNKYERESLGFLASVAPCDVSFKSRGLQYEEAIKRDWSAADKDVGAMLANVGQTCLAFGSQAA